MVPGETETEVPEPTNVPPHEPLYHCHDAPEPREPTFTVNVEGLPEHIVVGVADADVGAVEFEFTDTVTLTQAVVLHVPSARTK